MPLHPSIRRPIEFIGFMGAAPFSEVEESNGGLALQPEYVEALARAHEEGDFDRVLIGYGAVGLAAYVALWGAVLVTAGRRARTWAPAAAIVGVVAGLLVFNLVAGSLYHLQLMGVFWPVAGAFLAGGQRSQARGE